MAHLQERERLYTAFLTTCLAENQQDVDPLHMSLTSVGKAIFRVVHSWVRLGNGGVILRSPDHPICLAIDCYRSASIQGRPCVEVQWGPALDVEQAEEFLREEKTEVLSCSHAVLRRCIAHLQQFSSPSTLVDVSSQVQMFDGKVATVTTANNLIDITAGDDSADDLDVDQFLAGPARNQLERSAPRPAHSASTPLTPTATVAPKSDASCARCGKTEPKLWKCSRCKGVRYCSKECQSSDWKQHKPSCVVREVVVPKDCASIRDALVKSRKVQIQPGEYDEDLDIPAGSCVIGVDGVSLLGRVRIFLAPDEPVKLQNIKFLAGVTVKVGGSGGRKGKLHASLCQFSHASGSGVHIDDGEVLLEDCVIQECEDGVLNQAGDLHTRRCQIFNCSEDGIFSNPCIVVEDTRIWNVGRNGIKSRGGAKRIGDCAIQASPWDGLSYQY